MKGPLAFQDEGRGRSLQSTTMGQAGRPVVPVDTCIQEICGPKQDTDCV